MLEEHHWQRPSVEVDCARVRASCPSASTWSTSISSISRVRVENVSAEQMGSVRALVGGAPVGH